MKVNIVYLPYRRFHFSEVTLKILSQCNFKDFHITVCGMGHHDGQCQSVVDRAIELGLSAEKLIVTSSYTNYIDKLRIASKKNFEYSIKLDEDIFLNTRAWDFFFNNLDKIDDHNFILTPTLSSGIPTCDNFIYKFMDEDSKNKMYSIFSSTKIPNLWGANYSTLTDTLKHHGYESDRYYQHVANLSHFYKGIHPIRVSLTAQRFLNNWILDNINKFINNNPNDISGISRPYLCNSVFAIRTKEWDIILNDQSLFRDNFDEVALNLYRHQHGKNILIMGDTFGIHTVYNTLYADMGHPQDMIDAEEEKLFQKIKESIS